MLEKRAIRNKAVLAFICVNFVTYLKEKIRVGVQPPVNNIVTRSMFEYDGKHMIAKLYEGKDCS